MAEIGGMLASAVLGVLIRQIESAVSGQIAQQRGFTLDLEDMKMTLESVAAVLKDADKRSVEEESVRLWLKRLKDAIYGISDMIDEYEGDTRSGALKLSVMTPCLTIGPKVKMANKMKAMREHLKKITRQHKDFRFKEDSKSNIQQHNDIRETSSHKEALIVGRTREKHILMDYLSETESMKQKLTILPIYGIGGVGKTTMANSIFNDAQFEDYSRVWIYVSQAFNLNKIGNSIISQLSKEEKHITKKEIQYNRLQELLNVADKKTMIVLDDLWEEKESQLEELKAMLNVSESGKVIVIVTTRDEAIARKFCTIQPYKLPPLEDEMCWAIIKQKSSFDARNDKEKLKHIGKDSTTKSGGVALAAQTLGYMLKDMTFGEWQAVRSSDIWNVPSSGDESSLHHNVLSCLLLSYKNMPKHLKLCFAYCAVFPKGQKIIEDDLIYQWIAHDFIAPSSIFSTRLVSENYIKQLLGMSFLQHADSYLTNELNTKDVRLFTMHDLVHDLARSVMADEIFDDSKMRIIGGPNNCRYTMFSDCSKPLKLNVTCPIKIRSLRFLGCERIGLRSSAFSSAKCLRVLDLSGCSIPKLPCTFAELKQLRYLNAPRVQDQVIPKCITKLFKLSYLTLHESRIKELPDSIGEMECLMYLNLSYCTRLKKLPKSFVELKRLVHLDLSRCVCLILKPGLLMGLNKLVHLDLSDISFADDIIGQAFHYIGRTRLGVQEYNSNTIQDHIQLYISNTRPQS